MREAMWVHGISSRFGGAAWRLTLCLSLALAGVSAVATSGAAYAQGAQVEAPPALELSPAEDAVTVRWRIPADEAAAASAGTQLEPQVYANYLLPMQTFAVSVNGDDAPVAVASTLLDMPWSGTLEPAPKLEPPALDWSPPPWLDPAYEQPLPDSPLFLLRSGQVRGQHIAVYAFSEIYQDSSGALRRVIQMDAVLPGAAVLPDLTAENASLDGQLADDSGPAAAAAVAPPTNPLASQNSVKLFVSQQGIQSVRAQDLAGAGIQDPNAQNVRVLFRGAQVPLHVFDNNRDGKLTGDESIRFYAPRPGDYWNSEDVYWLVVGGSAGERMASRNVTSGKATQRTTAVETGVWTANEVFESTLPGPDGDNWFHTSATIKPTDTEQAATVISADLGVKLPLAAPADVKSVFKIGVTAVNAGTGAPLQVAHRLRLRGGSVNYTDSPTAWIVDFMQGSAQNFVRSITTSGQTATLQVGLVPGTQDLRVFFDTIEWAQPVNLTLGGKGAAFRGVDGTWTYKLSGTPDQAYVYDVTDPLKPAILGRTSGTAHTFDDGPTARSYIVAGTGTVLSPRIEQHKPIALGSVQGADAVYIAPAIFHDALQPLVAHREGQGLLVEVIDVQEIYDAWSFGHVSPNAIRDFLRHAVSSWKKPPISAVLVGDGTRDPRDYLGFGNPNHIPPYLAHVDPWLYITACEPCYAQLDGADPLSESAFLTDIWLGRLPVAETSELQAVVDKILRYEQDPAATAAWRNVSVQLADDWILEDGEKDGAGNFTSFIEDIATLQPSDIRFVRHYYNAKVNPSLLTPDDLAWLEYIKPWTETEQAAAQQEALRLLDNGAGLVTFTGHSNHWAWARMGKVPGYDYRLFGLWDVLQLTNKNSLFIGLSMTCLTSQFPHPESSHFTLDEHLVLHPNGGAVAMWGPAGLSVSFGHDALQEGFYEELWRPDAKEGREKLGRLIQAGYEHVVLHTTCCQDVTRTFLLLGDPLTPARVQGLDITYTPSMYSTSTVTE